MPIGMHDVQIDLVVALRKAHACGRNQWRVVRLGADVGIRCEHCQHRVLIPRSEFERLVTKILMRPTPPDPAEEL